MRPVGHDVIRFGRYRLHPTDGLRRGPREIHVTQKALGVLRLLAASPGRLVTKTEILDAVWPGVAVSDAALTSCIRELRRALDDDARTPTYIETLHRRGFRFLPQRQAGDALDEALPSVEASAPVCCVGRDDTLARLHASYAAAADGDRQLVVVEGEPGIGKTTLAQAFVQAARNPQARIAHAACVEQHEGGEPYRPLLDAWMRLCRGTDGGRVLAILRRCAPTWLAQLPALHLPGERKALERQTTGVTRTRMARELTDAVEALAADAPVILWLDDLHWADRPTLDWLTAFTQRRDRARVLVVASTRPADPGSAQVLGAEALVKPSCRVIRLDGLDRHGTHALVAARLRDADGQMDALADRLYVVTDGHPLFLTTMLDELQGGARDALRSAGVDAGLALPSRLQHLIESQIARLDPRDATLLEVGAVAAEPIWSAALVATAVDVPLADVERGLAKLAARGAFVRRAGTMTWPDGTIADGFAFAHAIHRDVLHARLSASRCADVHRRMGARLETAFAPETAPVAALLTAHFEAAGDWNRAVRYLAEAARIANARGAVDDGSRSLQRAVDLLARLPASDERDAREVELRVMLGATLMAARGWGASEVEAVYRQAGALCERLAATPQRFPSYWGLWLFRWGRGELATARDLTTTLRGLAHGSVDPVLHLQVEHAEWATAFSQGRFADALTAAEHGLAACATGTAEDGALQFGNHHPGMCARACVARVLALRGQAAEASAVAEQAVAEARRFEHPFSLALSLVFAAATSQMLRAPDAVGTFAEEAADLSRRHGFPLVLAWADALCGWTASTRGTRHAVERIQAAVRSARATGSGQLRTFLLSLLADAQGAAGDQAAGLATLEEAFAWAASVGERFHEAELYRLTGELHAAAGDRARATEAFGRGLEVAEAQGAQLYAQRNAEGLAR
jgi:DNA-binding winged helix-turn-helix (wHTH) protein